MIAAHNDGSGVLVAIVDAYDSPTLFSDSARYSNQNDSKNPLSANQFIDVAPAAVTNEARVRCQRLAGRAVARRPGRARDVARSDHRLLRRGVLLRH